MKNIGPVSGVWLAAVGVASLDDLDRIGSLAAWWLVDERFPCRASVTLLYALEAALLGIHRNDLPAEIKASLAARARAVRAAAQGCGTATGR